MDPATELISVSPAAAPATQLALRLPETDTDDSWLIVDGSSELPDYVQQRMRIIQQLLAARGTKTYTQVQRQAARSLGISVRSLRRLMKAWQELGVAGLSRQPRSDQGSIKASQEWQDFIVKTYKDGNRGSRQMSPARVVVQVQGRAQTLGVKDYPGRTTVYRILRPHIEKVQQKRSHRATALA
ncbi:helix-turn-helix domain-containing protein [Leptolyngbya sp. GB1-A1]|uniref:helix-turn-helix domain-containing protein n=1 Tax=Leptolyngbya sp. GB1-A1 TaxID=2933908 RepID=UPI0032974224